MARKRLLIAHPYITATGGGNVVAAWALNALREQYDITLATMGAVDCAALNRNFGTSLHDSDFRLRLAPKRYKAVERWMPTPGALLQCSLTARWAQSLARHEQFDALLSTHNELDFGRPGIHYIHFPWAYLPRPDVEMRWYHTVPGFLAAYRGICGRVARTSETRLKRNLFLVNSAWVGRKVRESYGVDSVVLHPPVPGVFPEIPWEERRAALVAVGRIFDCKRWDMAVEAVERVRTKGLDLGLTLIAPREGQPSAERQIMALAATRPWFRILRELSRADLAAEVAAHRYGIHTMEGEHFGIAVAEILRAGAIPFVHDSGGPVEIVGGRPELRFANAEDAAEKITAAMTNVVLENELRNGLAERRKSFSAERFSDELRQHIQEFSRAGFT